VGYLSHGVGDGFAHTWVNELAGGAWSVENGSGIYGSATEEMKHIAVERFIDSLVPDDLVNVPGDRARQRLRIQAPKAFLDAFFSAPVSVRPSTPNINTSPENFAKVFGRLDLFNGGPVSSYFNAQVEFGDAAKGWSRIGPVFDLAEDFQETEFVSTFLDIADFPAQLAADFSAAIPAVDPFDALTGGLINCYDPIGGGVAGDGTTTLENLRAIWRYLGTMNDRLDVYREKAQVVRKNWLHLSECSIQNLTNVDCFEQQDSTLAVRDACTVATELPFQDQGDPRGLFRGQLAGNSSPDVTELITDIQDAFRGGTTPAFENDRRHFKMGENVRRMVDYLSGAGMVLDDFAEVLVPSACLTEFS
jgi:hypothetical protein